MIGLKSEWAKAQKKQESELILTQAGVFVVYVLLKDYFKK